MIESELDCLLDIKYEKSEIAQPQQVSIDISPLKELGYEPKIKLSEGLHDLIEYYKEERK